MLRILDALGDRLVREASELSLNSLNREGSAILVFELDPSHVQLGGAVLSEHCAQDFDNEVVGVAKLVRCGLPARECFIEIIRVQPSGFSIPNSRRKRIPSSTFSRIRLNLLGAQYAYDFRDRFNRRNEGIGGAERTPETGLSALKHFLAKKLLILAPERRLLRWASNPA